MSVAGAWRPGTGRAGGALLLACGVLLPGCAALRETPRPARASSAAMPDDAWRRYATAADRSRLHDWREAFARALADARATGHARQVEAAGALLQPDAALPGAAVPAGDYRCRTVKLGRRGGTGLGYVDYPWFRCRVGAGDGARRFEKLTGSQRQVGTLYADGDPDRLVFLGTLALGDEGRALTYGVDPQRDVAGGIQRIGERRWRLLMPYPRFESLMDVLEIVPE